MAQPPVVSPPIPYIGSLRLYDHQKIIIQGKMHHHHTSFSINFTSSPDTNLKDTALHFNPRISEGCIVRNSLQYGKWGSEERHGGLPIQKNVPFEVVLHVHNHQYKMHINGHHFCDYKHRLPKESVNYLVISGDVEISFIKFEGGPQSSYKRPGDRPAGGVPLHGFAHPGVSPPPYSQGFHQPTSPAGMHSPPFAMGMHPPPAGFNPGGFAPAPSGYPGSQPLFNPAVPLTTGIPGQLAPGRMIHISGIPHSSPARMTINLMCGSDKALHFDARFNYGSDRNVCIRNHQQHGSYGSEERQQSCFPFMPNASFDMLILIEPNCYKVAVNNQHLLEFNHRIPFQNVTTLNIEGDVRLTQVRFQ